MGPSDDGDEAMNGAAAYMLVHLMRVHLMHCFSIFSKYYESYQLKSERAGE